MRTLTTKITAPIAASIIHGWQVGTTSYARALDNLSALCHSISVRSGWWAQKDGSLLERNVGELICLMHSELSEAMEGARKDLPSDHIPGFTMLEEELADVLVRIFDFAGAANLRLSEAFKAKCHYNLHREDHKPEVRHAEGGKQF
jgi:NTP pyrophosphatase (non-canonical NTP hydrolase)